MPVCSQCQAPLPSDGAEQTPASCPSCGTRLDAAAVATVDFVAGTAAIPGDTVALPASTVGFLPAGPDAAASVALEVVGDYELIDKLGAGGMGVVYRARQRGARRMVALKIVRDDRIGDLPPDRRREWIERFEAEARAAAGLQHDHIVTVYEVGSFQGRPFYSMRLVDGSSLVETIAEGPLANRNAAELMEHVAGAIHYAHEHGIVHRDLKPANILIDAQGRPYVTDFGIAKLLESDSHATQTGQIMGTPQYMSPEQARDSGRVTAASDVYSLGATLYELLTGRPPFRAATPVETLRQALEVEPVSPRQLNPAVDRDLETIALKCLEKEPRRRYASAAALAADLRSYLEGRPIAARPLGPPARSWRWCRRNPRIAASLAAVMISLAAVAGVATVAAVRIARAKEQTEVARGRSDANFDKARQAVSLMLSRVGDVDLEYVPQMEPVRRELLEAALRFYQGFLDERSDDPDVRFEAAGAYARVAEIQGMLGQHAASAEAVAGSIALLDRLLLDSPGDARYLVARSTADVVLCAALAEQGRHEEVVRLGEAAVTRLTPLPANAAEWDAALVQIAVARHQQGVALEALGKQDDAFKAFNDSLAAKRDLADRHPDNEEYRRDIAESLLEVAQTQSQHQRLEEADAALQEASALLEALVAADPAQAASRELLLIVNHHLGVNAKRADRLEDAERTYHEALRIAEALAADFPSTPRHRHVVAAFHLELGELLHDLGRYEESEEHYRLAREGWTRLTREHPLVPRFGDSLGGALNNLGNLLKQTGRAAEAEPIYREALALAEALAAANPRTPRYQTEVGRVCDNLANLLDDLAKREEAEALWRRSVSVIEETADAFPDDPNFQYLRANALGNLAYILENTGRPAEAETFSRRSLQIRRDLTTKYPHVPDFHAGLVLSYVNLYSTISTLGRADEAAAIAAEGAQASQSMVERFADVPQFLHLRAASLAAQAEALFHAERPAEADEVFRTALTLLEKLTEQFPDVPDFRSLLAKTQGGRAELLRSQGKLDEARTLLEASVATADQSVAAMPDQPEFRQWQAASRFNLGNVLVETRDFVGAIAAFREALALQLALLQSSPADGGIAVEACATRNNLADALREHGQLDEARAEAELAVAAARAGLAADAHDADWRNLWRGAANCLLRTLLARHDHRAAADVALHLTSELADDASLRVDAAGIVAQCSSLAAADESLPPEERAAQAAAYVDQAVELLRQAVTFGFTDFDSLRSREEFEPIRQNAAFRSLLEPDAPLPERAFE